MISDLFEFYVYDDSKTERRIVKVSGDDLPGSVYKMLRWLEERNKQAQVVEEAIITLAAEPVDLLTQAESGPVGGMG